MTFTSDSCAAMKHIEDLGPRFRVEEMEVVDKVNEDVQEEEMDHEVELELGKGRQVGEDDKDELEEGEIVDSDTEPGGEVTEVEEEEDEDRGYMGCG